MIICEVGLNHLGREDYSTYYVDMLSKTGCDAITYQIREPEFYQKDKYKGFDLSFAHYETLIQSTDKKFGVALADIDFLKECEAIGVDFYKVLSWGLTNFDFIDALLKGSEKSMYISTGTSSIEDIQNFYDRYGDNERINLIHTQLTQEPEDANLKAITTLKERFSYGIGFGNHSDNLQVILSAVAYEPQDIWFYVKGADFDWRFHPDEFWAVPLDVVEEMVTNIKTLEKARGSGLKTAKNTKGY